MTVDVQAWLGVESRIRRVLEQLMADLEADEGFPPVSDAAIDDMARSAIFALRAEVRETGGRTSAAGGRKGTVSDDRPATP